VLLSGLIPTKKLTTFLLCHTQARPSFFTIVEKLLAMQRSLRPDAPGEEPSTAATTAAAAAQLTSGLLTPPGPGAPLPGLGMSPISSRSEEEEAELGAISTSDLTTSMARSASYSAQQQGLRPGRLCGGGCGSVGGQGD
jgi:hypothetical protein